LNVLAKQDARELPVSRCWILFPAGETDVFAVWTVGAKLGGLPAEIALCRWSGFDYEQISDTAAHGFSLEAPGFKPREPSSILPDGATLNIGSPSMLHLLLKYLPSGFNFIRY
jgi:hypothetical protein